MICPPTGVVTKMINNCVNFEYKYESFLDKDDFRAIFTNTYDIILCDFLKKYLAPGDIFIDVGANIGYISAIAASYVGSSGEIHAFEPLKECFTRLCVLRDMNPGFNLIFNNVALGKQRDSLLISYNPKRESRNATLVPGHNYAETYKVPVMRLDDYIFRNIYSPERIKVIKIDVEGYECPVLRGLERFFVETTFRPLIVCEVKPWEIEKVGSTLEELDQYMKSFSYYTYDILQNDKRIDLTKLQNLEVVLFHL